MLIVFTVQIPFTRIGYIDAPDVNRSARMPVTSRGQLLQADVRAVTNRYRRILRAQIVYEQATARKLRRK